MMPPVSFWMREMRRRCATQCGGANDFGGTLMEETISRMAGAEWGIRKEPEELESAIRDIERTPMQRTTTYERVSRVQSAHP